MPAIPSTVAERRISICYIYSVIDNALAGTERHLFQLIAALDRRQFDPLLVVLQESAFTRQCAAPRVAASFTATQDSGLPLQVLGFRSLFRPADWWRILQLARLLRKRRVDIVEVHSAEGQMVGVLAAKLAGVPVILSGRRNLGYNYGRKERWQTRWSNRFVTAFLANSQAVADQRSRLEGIPADRFRVIPNGIDLPAFDAARAAPVDAAYEAFCRTGVVIAIAANLRPVKNHTLFLRAAQLVAGQHPEARLAILGSGPDEHKLRQLASELGIAERVYWAGSVTPIAAYLSRAEIAALTSDSEGFATAIVEAMAAGLPVVATQVGGAAEAIVSGQNGVLVEAGNYQQLAQELNQLLADPDLRQALGQAARRTVEQSYNWTRQRERFEQLYRAVIA